MHHPRWQGRTRILLYVVAVCAAVATFGPHLAAQASSAAPARDALMRTARDLMATMRYCAVITLDQHGWPQARTVDALPPDEHLVVWFATNPKSRKVAELAHDGRITLHYFASASPDQGYVTLRGRARLVSDASAVATHWKPEWEPFWPGRQAVQLVEVTPVRLEVVSPSRQVNPDPTTWTPQMLEFPAPAAGARK
mgnify:CR=1 FL=1